MHVGGSSVPFLMAMHLFFNRIWNPDLKAGQIVSRSIRRRSLCLLTLTPPIHGPLQRAFLEPNPRQW